MARTESQHVPGLDWCHFAGDFTFRPLAGLLLYCPACSSRHIPGSCTRIVEARARTSRRNAWPAVSEIEAVQTLALLLAPPLIHPNPLGEACACSVVPQLASRHSLSFFHSAPNTHPNSRPHHFFLFKSFSSVHSCHCPLFSFCFASSPCLPPHSWLQS